MILIHKKVWSTIIILLILLNFKISLQTKGEEIFTVDDDGSADYTLIQDAIDNASNGDIILVSGGVYYENLVINKTISLIGDKTDKPIIVGNNSEYIIKIIDSDVKISGFVIQNHNIISSKSILCEHSNVSINNNILINHYRSESSAQSKIAIRLYFSQATIYNNSISNYDHGVWIDFHSFANISNNVIKNSIYGIYDYNTSSIIVDNEIFNCSFGININGGSTSYILNNLIHNNNRGIESDNSYPILLDNDYKNSAHYPI